MHKVCREGRQARARKTLGRETKNQRQMLLWFGREKTSGCQKDHGTSWCHPNRNTSMRHRTRQGKYQFPRSRRTRAERSQVRAGLIKSPPQPHPMAPSTQTHPQYFRSLMGIRKTKKLQ